MTDTTALIEEVVDLLRQVHLPHIRHQAPDLVTTATAQLREPAEAVRALRTEDLDSRGA